MNETSSIGDVPEHYLALIAEKSHSLAERRNRVVHDHWRSSDGVARRLEISARKHLKFTGVAVDAAELSKLSDEIVNHSEAFLKLMRPYLQFPDED